MMTFEAGARKTKANQKRVLRDLGETIRRCCELERRGHSQGMIAKILNAEGHLTKSGLPFNQALVSHTLSEFRDMFL
jgi:hypothetical protein